MSDLALRTGLLCDACGTNSRVIKYCIGSIFHTNLLRFKQRVS
jgi:hypothetical protein